MRTVRMFLAAALCVAALPAAAQDWDAVTIQPTKVADGLWMLQGAGGNLAVSAGADGVLLVDDQFAPLAPKILEALRQLGQGKLEFVLNTHWHGDHRGGNEAMGRAGGTIVAHHNVRLRMADGGEMPAFGRTVEPAPAAALPVVTFKDEVRFHLNGLDIRVWHVPAAHTDGDAIVEFGGANVVHMGDIFFNGLYPVVDWGSGGTVEGMVAACDAALARMDGKTRVIPGHGPLTDKAGLKAYRDLLADVGAKVRALHAAGKTLEQVQAAKPTAKYDAKWGGGFLSPDAFTAMVYQAVARSPGK